MFNTMFAMFKIYCTFVKQSKQSMKSTLIQTLDQYAEVVEASIVLGISVAEVELIPIITGDILDSEELVLIYEQYLSYMQDCDYSQREEPSLRIWLLDNQFDGLSRSESAAERKRLLELGVEL